MTFPAPTLEFAEERYFDTLVSPYSAAKIHRKSRHRKRIRIFTLKYEKITKADKDLVEAEFLAAKGGAATTSFTPVDEGSPVTVRFMDDELAWQQVTGNTYATTVRLVEEVW